MNGILIVDKPSGITSSGAVGFVRRRLPKKTAIGHGGTLDPDATGVLPILIGSATRLFDYMIDKQKRYLAEIQLGSETDTQDASGSVVRQSPVTVGKEDLRRAAQPLVGEILQVPPMYSAVKRNGRRLYQLARKGEEIAVEPRKCTVFSIEIGEKTGENRYKMDVLCGKGVYIRTLCHDLGRSLGCGAHMASLRRTHAGAFSLEDAHTLEEIDALAQAGTLEAALIPPDRVVLHLEAARVPAAHAHAVKNGNPLKPEWLGWDTAAPEAGRAVRVYLEDDFAGIGEVQPGGSVRFRCMLFSGEQ